jgi:dUTP pyrophosphatase
MELKLKPLSPKLGKEIPLPAYATAGSAGMDLRACIDEPLTLPGQEVTLEGRASTCRVKVPTGLALAIPEGYVGLIFARSGLATKFGVAPANCVGVIDSDYRGEVLVSLSNSGSEDYTVQPGERIAQLVLMPVLQPQVTVTDTLDDTDRGQGGFGSTGKA